MSPAGARGRYSQPMAKRKKSKSPKRSSRGKKRDARKPETSTRAPVIESALFTGPDPLPPFTSLPTLRPDPAALTPKAALPNERGGKRERQTRGGKSTLPTHELLAEVPTPPRAKPATPRPKSKPQPPPKAPQQKAPPPQARTQPPQARTQPPQGKPAPRTRPAHAPTPAPAPGSSETLSMAQIYETLAALLVPYARKMESEMHPKIGFCLKAKSARTGRETHFGAVQALPDGVAFHLFPLYGHPDLLENVSPDLFNRLRGKTCFHFESLHAGLVAELAQLTHAGFERFLTDGVF